MASLAKALPFFFLLLIFSSLQIEARQRLFFSKVIHKKPNEAKIPVTQNPATPPSNAPTYAPAPEDGALFVPAPAPAESSDSELGYELDDIVSQDNGDQYVDTKLYSDNDDQHTNSNYVNGKQGFTNSYYNDNGNNNPAGTGTSSDTRFSENGSYYYQGDAQNEETDELNEYLSARGNRSTTKNEGYFGNSEKRFVFNTMEEYEKYQETHGHMP